MGLQTISYIMCLYVCTYVCDKAFAYQTAPAAVVLYLTQLKIWAKEIIRMASILSFYTLQKKLKKSCIFLQNLLANISRF